MSSRLSCDGLLLIALLVGCLRNVSFLQEHSACGLITCYPGGNTEVIHTSCFSNTRTWKRWGSLLLQCTLPAKILISGVWVIKRVYHFTYSSQAGISLALSGSVGLRISEEQPMYSESWRSLMRQWNLLWTIISEEVSRNMITSGHLAHHLVIFFSLSLFFRTCVVMFAESVNFLRNLCQKKWLLKSLISAHLSKWRKILSLFQCQFILQNQVSFVRVRSEVGRLTSVKNWTRHLMRSSEKNWTGLDFILTMRKNSVDLSEVFFQWCQDL